MGDLKKVTQLLNIMEVSSESIDSDTTICRPDILRHNRIQEINELFLSYSDSILKGPSYYHLEGIPEDLVKNLKIMLKNCLRISVGAIHILLRAHEFLPFSDFGNKFYLIQSV